MFHLAGGREGDSRSFHQEKNKPRQLRNWRGLMKKIPAATYSCGTYRPTTIGAAAFHFRVRNGTGWDHCALATGLQGEEFFIFFILPAREPLGGALRGIFLRVVVCVAKKISSRYEGKESA